MLYAFQIQLAPVNLPVMAYASVKGNVRLNRHCLALYLWSVCVRAMVTVSWWPSKRTTMLARPCLSYRSLTTSPVEPLLAPCQVHQSGWFGNCHASPQRLQ